MKHLLVTLAILAFSFTGYANNEFAVFKPLSGVHEGVDCSVEIRNLKKMNAEGYGISFPEWKYQVILRKDGHFVHEAIVDDTPNFEVLDHVILVDASKHDGFFTTHFQFRIKFDEHGIVKASLERKIPLIGFVKKASCDLK